MCLAEALLRIPDAATRDALIRDKIAGGDWRAHLGQSPSLFVNAATWGLVVTGRLTATTSESGPRRRADAAHRRGGEPLIRRGTDLAMRMMGEQFVTGQTIAEALTNSRRLEARGFRYSYDMLGEAATTAEDAARYLADYEDAIRAIGEASAGRGTVEGPGISIKLSALHPRYARAKRGRVMAELLPRVKGLAALARSYDIGLNIDAEEADRLELSLDLLEALALDPDLAGWDGIGFVLQAYGKRCPFAIDVVVDLARRAGRRIMVRLVKGAYWDSEIKRAQVDGQDGFPVFTRKLHTDVSYLACARKLLDAPDAVFPQFATHNAQTLGAILAMAGPDFRPGQYEFQCLHGMGEPLYDEVVGADKLGRPCRIYAPVGTHETLLAYLVRRLLENGANSSFVNRIADEGVRDRGARRRSRRGRARPVRPVGAPHDRIAAPRDLFGPAAAELPRPRPRGRGRARGARRRPGRERRHRWTALPARGGRARGRDGRRARAQPRRPPRRRGPRPPRHAGRGRGRAGPRRRCGTGLGRRARRRARRVPRARRRRDGGPHAGADRARRARGRQELRQCRRRGARGRRLPALLRGRGRAHASGPSTRRSAPWSASARGTSRWRSSPARSRRRWRPATRCWPSPPRRRRWSPPRPCACSTPPACRPTRCSSCPARARSAPRLVGDARAMGVMFTGSTAVARLIQRQLAGRLTPDGRPCRWSPRRAGRTPWWWIPRRWPSRWWRT